MLSVLAVAALGSSDGPDPAALYRAHAGSVVGVHGIVHQDESTDTWSFGAGVVLADGRILTACHVVRGGDNDELEVDEIKVTFGARNAQGLVRAERRVAAKVIRCDRERDLALIRVVDASALPRPLSLRRAPVAPGQAVVSLGHSDRGFAWSVHLCTVAGVGRLEEASTDVALAVSTADAEREKKSITGRYDKLEVDCPGHGSSGSVVVDAQGRVAGLLQHSRFRIRDAATTNYTFFYIAANEIQAFLNEF